MQYLKILKSLTRTTDKPSAAINSTKHLILQKIMKTPVLKFIILPDNFFPEIRPNYDSKRDAVPVNALLRYNMIKLHAAGINLLTECCHNYRLGIQETQRTLLYDQIKSLLLNDCFYIIKRAYIMLLFEIYINRVVED